MPRNLVHSYTYRRIREKKSRNNPIHHCNKKNTILGINSTKEAKDLDSENCKILMKEIKDNTNRWRDVPCSWIAWMNIVKMTILCKAIYRFNAVPIERKLLSLMVMTWSLMSWPSRCQPELHSFGSGRVSCTATLMLLARQVTPSLYGFFPQAAQVPKAYFQTGPKPIFNFVYESNKRSPRTTLMLQRLS